MRSRGLFLAEYMAGLPMLLPAPETREGDEFSALLLSHSSTRSLPIPPIQLCAQCTLRCRGGGFGGGGHTHTWKPGDWTCMACHSHCFASRDTCFRCGADRLGQRGPPPGPRFDPRYPQDPGMYPPFDPGMAGMPGAAFPPPGAESVYVHVLPPSIPGGYGDAAAWGRGPIKDGGYPMRYEAFEYQPHDTCYRVPGAPEAAPAAGGMSGGAPGFGGGAPGASGWVG